MAYSYENNQKRIEKLMQEMLSDESDFSPDHSEYEPSSEDSDSDPITPKKRTNVFSPPASQKLKVKRKLKIPINQDCQPSTSSDKTIHHVNDSPFQIAGRDVQAFSGGSPPALLNNASAGDFTDIDEIIESVIAQNAYDNTSDDENESPDTLPISWNSLTGNYKKNFPFAEGKPGIDAFLYDNYEKSPYEVYKMIINDDIFQLFVTETNRYAAQEKDKSIFRKSRIKDWKDTNQEEMENFLGIIMWMGIVTQPSISAYWSQSFLYKNNISKIMSSNRFQMLLKTWHFADNTQNSVEII